MMWCHSFHLLRHDLESPLPCGQVKLPLGYCRNRATTRCTIKRRGNCCHRATRPFPLILLSFAPFVRPIFVSATVVNVSVVLCFVVCTLFFCVVLRLLTVSRSLASHYCIVNVFRILVVVVLSTHPYLLHGIHQ